MCVCCVLPPVSGLALAPGCVPGPLACQTRVSWSSEQTATPVLENLHGRAVRGIDWERVKYKHKLIKNCIMEPYGNQAGETKKQWCSWLSHLCPQATVW